MSYAIHIPGICFHTFGPRRNNNLVAPCGAALCDYALNKCPYLQNQRGQQTLRSIADANTRTATKLGGADIPHKAMQHATTCGSPLCHLSCAVMCNSGQVKASTARPATLAVELVQRWRASHPRLNYQPPLNDKFLLCLPVSRLSAHSGDNDRDGGI